MLPPRDRRTCSYNLPDAHDEEHEASAKPFLSPYRPSGQLYLIPPVQKYPFSQGTS